MMDLHKLEWLILDSMADDVECVASIWPHVSEAMPGVQVAQLMQAIDGLCQQGCIRLAGDREYTAQEFLCSPADDCGTDYWFGLTAAGCAWWEEHARQHSGTPIDWSAWVTSHVDFATQTGYIEGVSEQACHAGLPDVFYPVSRWEIDRSTLRHSVIPGIQAKYYKYIAGGHRIDFRVRLKC